MKKGTGFFIPSSRRLLQNYKNCIKPEREVNRNITRELRHKVKDFSDKETYVVLLMDKIKKEENQVWDKHNGELIGYVHTDDTVLNYATLSKATTVASHVLVFFIRSIVNPFKFSLGNFETGMQFLYVKKVH